MQYVIADISLRTKISLPYWKDFKIVKGVGATLFFVDKLNEMERKM